MRAIEFQTQDIANLFAKYMDDAPAGKLGIAVSGGSDSLALMYLTADWAKRNNRSVSVISIDHGLRNQSESECKMVEEQAKSLNLPHQTVKWLDRPIGNLQSAARDARHQIIKEWVSSKKLSAVLFGHTLDDNAETFVLRLVRGSGVDGLAGISSDKTINGLRIFRPLLNFSRDTLRRYLEINGYSWIDDPSNWNRKFDRVKIRQILSELQRLGLSKNRLVATTKHMRRAHESLKKETIRASGICVCQEPWGGLSIELASFREISKEIQLRILSAGLMWISGKVYKPRFYNLERLLSTILCGETNSSGSLMGVLLREENGKTLLIRDFSAVSNYLPLKGNRLQWDRKWDIKLNIASPSLYNIGPVAQKGILCIGKYTDYGIPKFALMSSVGLFKDDTLICAPIISHGVGMEATILGGSNAFQNYLSAY